MIVESQKSKSDTTLSHPPPPQIDPWLFIIIVELVFNILKTWIPFLVFLLINLLKLALKGEGGCSQNPHSSKNLVSFG